MLYDDGVRQLKTERTFGGTFVTILPTVWWVAQALPASIYPDWHHDPAFFEAYQIPAIFSFWVYERTGWWAGQAYWVNTQDAVVGIVVALLCAAILKRLTVWQGSQMLRSVSALVGVLLPWYPTISTLTRPEY